MAHPNRKIDRENRQKILNMILQRFPDQVEYQTYHHAHKDDLQQTKKDFTKEDWEGKKQAKTYIKRYFTKKLTSVFKCEFLGNSVTSNIELFESDQGLKLVMKHFGTTDIYLSKPTGENESNCGWKFSRNKVF